MKKSFLWISSLLLTLQMMSCKDHECPTTRNVVVVFGNAEISDAGCNSLYPTANGGGDGRMQTCAWTYSGNFGATRTFINFDLSSIPAGATIVKAELTLFADTTNYISTNPAITGHSTFSGSNSWKIKRITSAWTEGTLTWNVKPSFDNVGAISMPQSNSNDQTYKVDIATFLNDQLHNPGLYYGIMFQLDTEVQYRTISFCSTEHPYAAKLAPTLRIIYKI